MTHYHPVSTGSAIITTYIIIIIISAIHIITFSRKYYNLLLLSITFSCNKYDNLRRKAFNDINEVDNIKLEIGNKVEKLKLFFAEVSLKALNILGKVLMRAFEFR